MGSMRDWRIVAGGILIVLLLGAGGVTLFGTEAGNMARDRLEQSILGLQGVQWLLSRLDLLDMAHELEAERWGQPGAHLARARARTLEFEPGRGQGQDLRVLGGRAAELEFLGGARTGVGSDRTF
jgi:hypothetical protein